MQPPKERLKSLELFIPPIKDVYKRQLNDKSAFIDSTKPMNRDQESFITFKEPIAVSGNFFIGYKIKSAAGNIFFSAFNLPKGETSKNTVWINYKGQWIEATSHPASPMSTS